MMNFNEYCLEMIKDEIEGYEGQEVLGSDLSSLLTEVIRANGSCENTTNESKKYLFAWQNEMAEYVRTEIFEDTSIQALLNNPDLYMVNMVCVGVRNILLQSKFLLKNYDRKITLTKENITTILEQIKDKQVQF